MYHIATFSPFLMRFPFSSASPSAVEGGLRYSPDPANGRDRIGGEGAEARPAGQLSTEGR